MSATCPGCGGNAYRYDRIHMKMVCRSCGRPQDDPAQERGLMLSDRTFHQASEHLLAGNWDQAISILKPMASQHPTEKRIYETLFQAATEDYCNLEMLNHNRRAVASDAWDKLKRLNGITPSMLRYSSRRHQQYVDELLKKRDSIVIWLLLASASLLFFGIGAAECLGSILSISFTALGISFYKLLRLHPVSILRQLSNNHWDFRHNPFT